MYKSQFPQLILLFSSLFFCLTSGPQTLSYSLGAPEQSATSEKTTSLDHEADGTPQPRYRIRQLRFDGNEHLNDKS